MRGCAPGPNAHPDCSVTRPFDRRGLPLRVHNRATLRSALPSQLSAAARNLELGTWSLELGAWSLRSILLQLRNRPPPGKSRVDLVPEIDRILSQLPAQEHDPILVLRGEIDDSAFEIFDHHAQLLDRTNAGRETIDHVL